MIALSPLQSVRNKLEPCSRAIPRENPRWSNMVKNASPDVVHDQLTLEFAQIMDVPKTNWQYQGGDCNLVVLFCWTIIRLRGNLVRIMLNAAAWPVCSLQSTLSSTAVYKGERLTQPTGVSVHHLKTQKFLVFMLTVTQLQWSWDRSFNNGCKMGDFQHLSGKRGTIGRTQLGVCHHRICPRPLGLCTSRRVGCWPFISVSATVRNHTASC